MSQYISMTVGGVNTYSDLGLVMEVEELAPPSVKEYKVDVPGGNGCINLTKALTGETSYDNRSMEFKLTMESATEDFERVKTLVSNMWHGQEFDFQLSFDPDYTYHGWFSVDSYSRQMNLKQITVKVDAEPYKRKYNPVQTFNAVTGVIAYPISGRKTVQPKMEFSDDTIVIFDGVRYEMPEGTYTMNDVWFTEGGNEIFFMSANARSHITHKEMASNTFRKIRWRKPIHEWYRGILKHSVSTITLKPGSEAITGEITFTATDANGKTASSTLDIGDMALNVSGDIYDYIEINDNTARLIRWLEDDGSGVLVASVTPTVFTFEFVQLFSNDAAITALSHNTTGTVTYTTESINTERVFIDATNADYAEGGTKPMTHADMSNYRISQLFKIDTETNEVYEEASETVYLEYEWSDL